MIVLHRYRLFIIYSIIVTPFSFIVRRIGKRQSNLKLDCFVNILQNQE